MSTKRKAEKRTPRATRNGADREKLAQILRARSRARLAELPGIVYVWRGDNVALDQRGELRVGGGLPEGVASGRVVGVYHLVEAGELKVTRELKR